MQIDVQIARGQTPDRWDEMLIKLGGTLFQSAGWAEYQRGLGDSVPLFASAHDDKGALIGMAVLQHTRSSMPILAQISGRVELPGHPAVSENARMNSIMAALENKAREIGCARLVLNSNMSAESPFSPSDHGYAVTRRLEFLADLTRDEDELMNSIAKDQRARIRKLERDGVIIEESSDRADLYGLRIARETAQERRTERGQGYELTKSNAFYDRIYNYLLKPGIAKLFVARATDDIVAAILFGAFNGRAYSIFSGSTKEGYKMGAQSGLYWCAVQYFRERGFSQLNRGGLPASSESEGDPLHGIYRFKKRLGTEPVLCTSGVKVLSPMKESLNQFRKKLQSRMTVRN